ncbi:MAG: hypothetical protein AAFV33_14190, partial [Chloroflexota bacterium]
MPRITLRPDGELPAPYTVDDLDYMPPRQTKRKSRLWRYATFLFLPLTCFTGVEVALFTVGPVMMVIVIALFSIT